MTEFRAISQSYYVTDTWRMRDNMTLDLGLRYEYVPPFEDKAGTLINASMPFFDQGLPVADKSRHPTLVRIGEGDFYEDFNIRYNPAMQTARDGRLGNRLVDDDKLNFAPRAGWAWTPTPATSIRAGVGMFYMQDTGNPRFDMARNAAGRRQDTSNQFFSQNWNAPFVGSGTNACGVQPPIVCISNHYVLGNDFDRTTPRMLQYLFNVQREIGGNSAIEIGYLGSRSYQLERMFDRNDVLPGPGDVQDKRPYPEFTRVQTIGNVAEAKYNSLTAKLTRRLNNGFSALIGYTLSKSEDNGSGIRTLNGDQLFPQNSNCVADEVCSGCEWGLSIFDVAAPHRLVDPLRAAVWRRQEVRAGRRRWRDPRRLADHQHHEPVERLPEEPEHRTGSREPGPRRSDRPECRSWPGSERWTEHDSAVVQHRGICAAADGHLRRRRAESVLSDRGSSTSTCRSCGTSRSAAARACSSGSRRSTRSISPSGRIRTRR